MFIYKDKIIEIKKITFENIDKFLFFFNLLLPETKDKEIKIKQKSKKIFKFTVKNLVDIICEPKIKPFFISEYMYVLTNILKEVKIYDILKKIEGAKDSEKSALTPKGEKIFKSDYTNLYSNSFYKYFLKYIPCFETEFKSKMGFLEYEEIVTELEKNRLKNVMQNIFNSACGFGGGEDYIKEIKKNIEELEKFGFDEKKFREDLLGVGG